MYTDNCYSLFDFKNTLHVFNSISSCEGLSPIHLDKLDNIDYSLTKKTVFIISSLFTIESVRFRRHKTLSLILCRDC